MNMNIFGGCMYGGGTSFVRSEIMPTPKSVREGEDVFAFLIEEAHAAGIQVHPAINCMHVGKGWGWPYILDDHPEWGIGPEGKKSTKICDVHRPEFRDTLIRYVADVAKRYDIDGVKLDFTRTMQTCFCEKCVAEYREETGRELAKDARPPYTESFFKWQEDAVGELVKGMREALDSVRPGLKLSHWGHDAPGCHSPQGRRPDVWLNNGWIDWFEISCYGSDPDAAVYQWIKIAKRVERPACVWPAFGTYKSGVTKDVKPTETYVPLPRHNEFTGDGLHSGCAARRAKALLPMYEAFRDRCNMNGFAVFDLSYCTRETAANIGKLVFPEPAVPWFSEKQPERDVCD